MTEESVEQKRNWLVTLSSRMRVRAGNIANAAGQNGRADDGGARSLVLQCEAFEAGLGMKVPQNWKEEAAEMKRLDDPEYQEYKRLKKKFGNK
jgi:hypothetical protein